MSKKDLGKELNKKIGQSLVLQIYELVHLGYACNDKTLSDFITDIEKETKKSGMKDEAFTKTMIMYMLSTCLPTLKFAQSHEDKIFFAKKMMELCQEFLEEIENNKMDNHDQN